LDSFGAEDMTIETHLGLREVAFVLV
jgi:hypothetical protein